MKEILVSLCGRGGSKGVRNKNIRPLCGIPLIAWTLYDAERLFESRDDIDVTIVVDSDSNTILETARRFCPAALLHKRSDALAGDRIAKMDVLREVLFDTVAERGKNFYALIDLDITSPLRTSEDIEEAFSIFENHAFDVVFSVVPSRRNPYFNMVERDPSGSYRLSKPSGFVARQQAPQVYDMNASLYIYRPEIFKKNINSPTSLDFGVFVMRDYGIIDIDSEEDLERMELLLTQGEHLLSEPLSRKREVMLAMAKRGGEGG